MIQVCSHAFYAGGAMIDAPPEDRFNPTRRLALTVRDANYFAENPKTSSEFGCRSQNIRRALRLTVLFAALASIPCLAQDASNAGAGPVATVSMDHNTFTPGEITVVPGTTVTWVNNEAMPHTVVDLNKGFRSKTLAKDAKFSFTFTTAGDYSYLCSIHPNMKGKIIVKLAS
jgi:plastocyanin